jgi:hypothetical protein
MSERNGVTAEPLAGFRNVRLKLGLGNSTARLLIILDRSLSMAGHEELVIRALRGFLDAVKSGPNLRPYLLTLVQFAEQPQTCALAQSLESVSLEYKPDGAGTAVWDAMAHSLGLEKSRQEPVICVIVTDGQDNASREADQKQVLAMIKTRREWGNWTFLWLNLEGRNRPSKNAAALGLKSLDIGREEIGEVLPALGQRISRATTLTDCKRISIESGGQ